VGTLTNLTRVMCGSFILGALILANEFDKAGEIEFFILFILGNLLLFVFAKNIFASTDAEHKEMFDKIDRETRELKESNESFENDLKILDNATDLKVFTKIKNVTVRTRFIKKFGVERIILACGSRIIDKKGDYELLLFDLGGTTGYWPYLKMLNPSIGVWHVEAVGKKCKTVDDAIIWRNQTIDSPRQLT